jgi:[CysO sulfur-carrier protein]-S-L-cysteine hydrolase
MRMSASQHEDLVEHARDSAPNECCGYMRLRDGAVEELFRAENLRNSPYGYELDAKSLLRANELDDDGFGVAVYHSHPRSPAEPSQTDINLAQYPHWLQVIVTLDGRDGGPEVRAWRIEDGRVEEEDVLVE